MKLSQEMYGCMMGVLLSAACCHASHAGTMGNTVTSMDNWTRFYAGINTGWGWSSFSAAETPFGTAAIEDIIPQSLKANTNGPLFGGQIGYNHQFDRVLLGIEADLDGTGIQGNAQSTSTSIKSLGSVPNGTSNNGFSVNQNTRMLGSVRGRLGTEVNFFNQHPGLAYFTAGYAWRQLQNNVTANGNVVGVNYWSEMASSNYTWNKSGYALGAGGEWQIASNWSLRAEYMFYGFSGTNNNGMIFPNAVPAGAGVNVATSNNNVNTVRFGVNYLV